MSETPRRRSSHSPWRHFLQVVLTILIALAGISAFTVSSAAKEPSGDKLHLATGSVGGTFLPVGHDIAKWLEEKLPGVEVVVDTTHGSVDNLSRLVQGKADLAIVGSSPYRKVLVERGRRALAKGAAELCPIGTLYDDAEQFIIRADMVRAATMLDLNGVLMYPGPRNSGAEVDTRTVLQTLGVEPQYIYPIDRNKGYSEAAAALARGEFHACTFSGGVPIAAVSQLFTEHPGEFLILPFSRHQLSKVRHAHLDFEPVVINAGAYPGIESDIVSVGGPNLLVAGSRLSPGLLQAIHTAIRDGIEEQGAGLRAEDSHPVLRILTPDLWLHIPVHGECLEKAEALNTPR